MANGLLMSPFDDEEPVAVGSLIALGTVGVNSGTDIGADEGAGLDAPIGVMAPPLPRLWAPASRPFSHAALQASTAHIILRRKGFMDASYRDETLPALPTGLDRSLTHFDGLAPPGTLKALRSTDASHPLFAQIPDNPCFPQIRWSGDIGEPDRTRQAR